MTSRTASTSLPTRADSRFRATLRILRREFAVKYFVPALPAALLCWFLTVIFSVSLAALIFRGVLAPFFAVWHRHDAVHGGCGGAGHDFREFDSAGHRDSERPYRSDASPADRHDRRQFPARHSERLLPTCLAALILSTLLTGLTLLLLGRNRLGQVIRFLPFPVIGGFMAGAGFLLVKGALTVGTGEEVTIQTLPLLFGPQTALRWIPSLTAAVVLVTCVTAAASFADRAVHRDGIRFAFLRGGVGDRDDFSASPRGRLAAGPFSPGDRPTPDLRPLFHGRLEPDFPPCRGRWEPSRW